MSATSEEVRAAAQAAREALAAASPQQLLDQIITVTHQVHVTATVERAQELRSMRADLSAELLSRIPTGPRPSARSLDLAVVALESAAQSCQSGATLTGRGVDPLAREYLVAAAEVEALS